MRSTPGPGWRDPHFWLALAAAAPLRLVAIAGPSLWLDEALSARTAALSPADIVGAAGDLHPPGYYLLLHAWTLLFQPNAAGFPGEWALRSFSVIASLALVPLAFWLGHAWATAPDRRAVTARLAAWIAALSPYAIGVGREARAYALLSLLLAAQFALWTRLREGRGGAASWGGVALIAAAGMYVHYHALLFTVALAAASLLRGPDASRRFGLRFALAAGAALLLFAPWLPRAAAQTAGGVRGWVTFSHSPFIILRTLAAFVRGDNVSAGELSFWLVPVAFLLWRGVRRGAGVLALPVLLPLAVAFAASFATPIFEARYFGGTAVATWVLLARGAAALEPLRSRRWAIATLALVFLACGVGIVRRSGQPAGRDEPWRELVQAVEAASPRGTAVAFPFTEPLVPFVYYARPGHLTLVGSISFRAEGGASLARRLTQVVDQRREALGPVWWVPYQEELYDPERLGRRFLLERGFTEGPAPIRAGRLAAIPFHSGGVER